MSSDGHVSDHGRQVVESIEEFDDVEMGSSEDENLQRPRQYPASKGGIVVKREGRSGSGPASDGGNDSGDEHDPLEDAAGSGRHVVAKKEYSSNDEGESEHEDELSKEQEPPSYQVSSRGTEYSPDDTDSTTSAASQLEEGTSGGYGRARKDKGPRKRKSPTEGPDLGSMDGATDCRPMKKKAKGSFNRAYLDLLNEDIEHAASQYVPPENGHSDERIALPTSQIGMTVWTSMEKERFFEALGRLGRDNVAAVAQRVRTKGEMEVRQYMKLLQDGLARRRQQKELDPLELADFPAAVELSHDCCQALEEAADNIAMRQEHSENAAEERKHGPGWLVSLDDQKGLSDIDTAEDTSKVTGVFRISEWLSLSERFFMNAPSEEGNWQSVEGDKPSIRLTTLEDFHSLALTLTRRLVAASLYMATARIRGERGYRPELRACVKEKDCQAAAMSLGLPTRKPPLTGCVRRLGLRVYVEPPKPHEDDKREPMLYDAVEDELEIDGQRNVSRIRRQMERVALSSEERSISSDSSAESDAESEAEGAGSGSSEGADSEEEEDVKTEAIEAILYSAVDPPQTKRDRQALLRRIKAERAQERYADAVDAQASYQEEICMWSVLGKERPDALVDPGPPPSGRRLKLTVDAAYSVGKDWRAKTEVIGEWEARYQGRL